MTNVTLENESGTTISEELPKNEKQLATIVYVLQALTIFTGFTAIVGLIINYVKRGELTSEVARSHFSWQIRTFWWSLVWGIIGTALTAIGIGIVVLVVVGIWYIYRFVKGWLRLNDGKPI